MDTPLLGMSGDTSKTAECRAACRRNRCSAKRASKALGLNLGVLPDHPAQRDWVEGFFPRVQRIPLLRVPRPASRHVARGLAARRVDGLISVLLVSERQVRVAISIHPVRRVVR